MQKELILTLLALQKKMPHVKKETSGYNYRYADMATVWNAVGKLITEAGFVITHESTPEGVKTAAHHEQGTITSFIPYSQDVLKPQEVGSELTYYKRYNLVSLFNIVVEGDDDDGQKAQSATPTGEVKEAGSCPNCGKKMKVSKAGHPYCPGKYDNTCIPKTQYSKIDQEFIDSLPPKKVMNRYQGDNQSFSG